jgi:hypothetical protein
MHQQKTKKILLILLIFFFSLLLAYWLKSMLGWDLSSSHQLSNSFPFNVFQRNHLLILHKEGIILEQHFDSFSLENIWSLWSRIPDTVHFERNRGPEDTTKSLVFINNTDHEWIYGFSKFIKVQQGDIFSFYGSLKKNRAENFIAMRISSFDDTKKPLNWSYKEKYAQKVSQWSFLADEFIIKQPEIAYIKFQLAGKGKGEFRFDDIFFTYELKGRPSPDHL